jgi:hypothetical protein
MKRLQESIDVETAIRDGALDVGLFAPKALLSESTAEFIFTNIQNELSQLGR